MGPGHLAVGFAAKPLAPKVPLWALLVATEVSDLLSFGFVAAGIETQGVYTVDVNQGIQESIPALIPWSHGLFMCIVWSVIAAAIGYFFYRERRTSIILGLVVFSHWILDFIVHPAHLPLLFEGSPTVGLGLWTSGAGLIISVIMEFALLGVGIAIYLRTRKRTPAPAFEG